MSVAHLLIWVVIADDCGDENKKNHDDHQHHILNVCLLIISLQLYTHHNRFSYFLALTTTTHWPAAYTHVNMCLLLFVYIYAENIHELTPTTTHTNTQLAVASRSSNRARGISSVFPATSQHKNLGEFVHRHIPHIACGDTDNKTRPHLAHSC